MGCIRHGFVWIRLDWVGLGWIDWLGLAWIGLNLFGLVWICLDWFGLVWNGLDWFGLAWFKVVWTGLIWIGLKLQLVWIWFASDLFYVGLVYLSAVLYIFVYMFRIYEIFLFCFCVKCEVRDKLIYHN